MLKNSDQLNKDFQIDSLLGKGNFGEVYSITSKNKIPYDLCAKVCKLVPNNKDITRAANTLYYEQTLIMGHLQQFPYRPRTPDKFYGETQIEKSKYRYLIMERLDISLYDYFVEVFSFQSLSRYALDILDGFKWLHEHNILLIDVKPENFMLKDNKIYFIDFGLVVLNTHTHKNQPVPVKNNGTPTFLSLDTQKGEVYAEKDDIESFAYVLISLLNSNLPWSDSKSEKELLEIKETYNMKKYCKEFKAKELYKILKLTKKLKKDDKIPYEKIGKYLKKLSDK